MPQVMGMARNSMSGGGRFPEEPRSGEIAVYERAPPTEWNGIISERRLDDGWIHNRDEKWLIQIGKCLTLSRKVPYTAVTMVRNNSHRRNYSNIHYYCYGYLLCISILEIAIGVSDELLHKSFSKL